MNEIVLDFERYEDDAPVKCVVIYEYKEDFDFVPCGEGMVKHEYCDLEIRSISYYCDGKPYKPTDYERKFWESDLEDAISSEIGRAA